MDDLSHDSPPIAKLAGRFDDMAMAQRIANGARGEGREAVIIGHLIDHRHAEAQLPAEFAHRLRRALAAVAEMEIITGDDMGDAEPLA